MKLAQMDSGEIDCVYTPGGGRSHSNYAWDDRSAFNYTQAVAVMEENDIEHHLAPRYQMCPPGGKMNLRNTAGEDIA